MYHGPICLGLTGQSTNEEIKKAAFDFALGIGYMSFATITAGCAPEPANRALEVHRLDDDGNLYVGASHGKHFYREAALGRKTCAVAVDTVSVRISARLIEVEKDGHRANKEIYDRYWRQNPGTLKMYGEETSNFKIFRFASGNGEVFYVYEDDKIARVRFAFGSAAVKPWSYTIGENCAGCGACTKNCMMQAIQMRGHKAHIQHYGCNECGICHETCAFGAIDANGFK